MALGLACGALALRLTAGPPPRPGNGASPPFLPSSLAGLRLWLSARRSPVLITGGGVERVDDLSGLGRDAVQADAAARPLLVDVAGRDWLRFNGVDQFLHVGDIEASPDAFFVVAAPTNATSGASAASVLLALSGTGSLELGDSTAQLTLEIATIAYPGGGRSGWIEAGAALGPGGHVLSFVWDGAKYAMWVDGEPRPLTLAGQAPVRFVFDTVRLARRHSATLPRWFNGRIGEVVVYDTFDPAKRGAVEGYLAAEWGVAL